MLSKEQQKEGTEDWKVREKHPSPPARRVVWHPPCGVVAGRGRLTAGGKLLP